MSEVRTEDASKVSLRHPELVDGAKIWELVGRTGDLERNPVYAYLLLCRDFLATSLVARDRGRLVGFVWGYRPPSDGEVIFVWQIGVHPEARHRGIGGRLLDTLVGLPACGEARYLEATVATSNTASRAMFEAFARRRGARCDEIPGFSAEHFGDVEHEAEHRLRIEISPNR